VRRSLGEEMKGKKIKVAVGGFVILLAIVYLVYLASGGGAPYYLTPSELATKGRTVLGEEIRLGGRVADGSINWDSWNQKLVFELTDGKKKFIVRYQGFIPDSFKSESEVVAEGILTPEGFFQARSLLVKCPSKYLPEQAASSLLEILRLEKWLYW